LNIKPGMGTLGELRMKGFLLPLCVFAALGACATRSQPTTGEHGVPRNAVGQPVIDTGTR